MNKKLTTNLVSVTLAITIPFAGMHIAHAEETTQLQPNAVIQNLQTIKDPALANEADDFEQALELISTPSRIAFYNRETK
ncbi:hypothetical protein [Corynebacterium sp. HS2168-gen11]|uniref:hypothetical protein n=1 Tax=Corynebacterium sp. HS2168-gen11 TaxID=2974027 RepID=UPI00216B612F|nr:hypothetical protein [Corynebacterium sp. HS2168-gen11]MCS4536345.1 hypothetical protein [Corynebacterium sp. HS2168-gen11]